MSRRHPKKPKVETLNDWSRTSFFGVGVITGWITDGQRITLRHVWTSHGMVGVRYADGTLGQYNLGAPALNHWEMKS